MRFVVVRLIHLLLLLTGKERKEQSTMTANTTTEQFGHLVRTVDPVGLGTEDTRAYWSNGDRFRLQDVPIGGSTPVNR